MLTFADFLSNLAHYDSFSLSYLLTFPPPYCIRANDAQEKSTKVLIINVYNISGNQNFSRNGSCDGGKIIGKWTLSPYFTLTKAWE